ncbi:MAG: NAD-dependent epimerase/dehydratase family protein [bacterium]
MKLLITGVSGFIGQRVVARLIRHNPFAQIHGIDRRPPRILGPVRFVQADLRTLDLADLIVTDGIDVVLHLAYAMRAGLSNARDEVAFIRRLGTAAVESELPRLVVASRDRVYAPSDRPVREDAPLRAARGQPPTVGAKLRTEAVARELAESSTRVVVVRSAHIMGPRPGGNLQKVLSMRWLLGAGERDPLVQLLHVDDAAATFLAACTATDPKPVYNAAADDPLPLSVVAGILQKQVMQLPPAITRVAVGALSHTRLLPYGANELAELHGGVPMSIRRLTTDLYTPRYTTRQTLAVWRTGYEDHRRSLARPTSR